MVYIHCNVFDFGDMRTLKILKRYRESIKGFAAVGIELCPCDNLDNAKARGLYGEVPFVLYTGTNALYEIAVSEDEADNEIYHQLGEFITNSPLKNK